MSNSNRMRFVALIFMFLLFVACAFVQPNVVAEPNEYIQVTMFCDTCETETDWILRDGRFVCKKSLTIWNPLGE